MKKNILSSILILALTASISLTCVAAAAEDDATIDGANEAQSAENITIMPTVERPEAAFVESLDDSMYVGGYWEGNTLHIIPVPGHKEELDDAAMQAQKSRSSGMPQIVIDNYQAQERSALPVYSMADREAGKEYLLENQNTLNIQAVGFTADKLAVFMNEGATTEDEKAVLEASPVKAIEFYGELMSENEDTEPIEDTAIQTRATATTLRGGNWARTTASSNWSTIAVSAVRNWNGSSGDIGFITCGHGWTNGQVVYASDGTRVGIADVRLSNNMDVTFVKLDNTSLNSHGYLKNGTQITKNIKLTSVDINKSITKHGARTGTTSGTIKVLGISGNWSGYSYNNLILTSCTTQKGDSGCSFVMGGDTIAGMMVGARSSSPIVGGTSSDPIYGESVMLPISDVISGPKFLPCT